MYASIIYELVSPENLENDNKQLKVKNVSFTLFPQKKYAIAYSYAKTNISNYFKVQNNVMLIENWYGIKICLICKYHFGDNINNKIEKYGYLDRIIRNALKEIYECKYKSYSKYDKSIKMSMMIPEYQLYVKNKTNKIHKLKEPIYEIVTDGIITKEHLIHARITLKFWDKIENNFAFLIGTNIIDIDKCKELFDSDYYSFAKPKNKV